ncbi:MAG: hypothetical protein ACYDAM_11495 [Leptospirales bacterium]
MEHVFEYRGHGRFFVDGDRELSPKLFSTNEDSTKRNSYYLFAVESDDKEEEMYAAGLTTCPNSSSGREQWWICSVSKKDAESVIAEDDKIYPAPVNETERCAILSTFVTAQISLAAAGPFGPSGINNGTLPSPAGSPLFP